MLRYFFLKQKKIMKDIALSADNLCLQGWGFLFHMIRNVVPKKFELFRNWNCGMDNSKVLPSLIKSKLVLTTSIVDCCH